MARKSPKSRDPNPDDLNTISENGKAPDSRFKSASQVWKVCDQLLRDNDKRSKKNQRLWKAYNRHPPTDYSTLVELKIEGQSNVNWGLLAFIINNNKTSFSDMVRERVQACDIITKIGTDEEKKTYSELISYAYDQYGLREWCDYMYYTEQDIQDMLLFGKAVEMMDLDNTYESEHVPIGDLLVPDDTELNLKNFDCMARMKRYTLNNLWGMIKNKKEAEEMGWNVDACVQAMRHQREDWKNNKTHEQFAQDISAGNIAFSSVMKERVAVYEMFIKEYDGTISKHVVLQNYDPLLSSTRNMKGKIQQGRGALPESAESIMDKSGFLFTKTGKFECIDEVMAVFINNVGSGLWHVTPSLAESVFVQCRQYDITMNSIMDAIKLNMTLMLQGNSADASQKLKEMVWGQFAVLPSDMQFVQQRLQIDTNNATNTLQFMMSDVYSGIGNYRIQEKDKGGEQPTATQRQLDAAESARLSGSEIGRYNDQHTVYHRQMFKRFVETKEGMDGYERFKKFKDYLKDNEVPDKAWDYDNIEKITSNMLAGAGSPSFKLMAANQIITFTNMTAKDDGQRSAIEDGIAAVAGRSNVHRYVPKKKQVEPTLEDRYIGLECEAFADPLLNPQNVLVLPKDNHIKHLDYHLNDMSATIMNCEQKIKDGSLDEATAMSAMTRVKNELGHTNAHMQILGKDSGKQPIVKEYAQKLGAIQKALGQLQKDMQAAQNAKQQQQQFNPSTDPDMQRKIAMSQLDISTAKQMADIKLGSIAQSHEVRQEAIKDKASTDIAIARAKAQQEAESGHQQHLLDMQHQSEQHQQDQKEQANEPAE